MAGLKAGYSAANRSILGSFNPLLLYPQYLQSPIPFIKWPKIDLYYNIIYLNLTGCVLSLLLLSTRSAAAYIAVRALVVQNYGKALNLRWVCIEKLEVLI